MPSPPWVARIRSAGCGSILLSAGAPFSAGFGTPGTPRAVPSPPWVARIRSAGCGSILLSAGAPLPPAAPAPPGPRIGKGGAVVGCPRCRRHRRSPPLLISPTCRRPRRRRPDPASARVELLSVAPVAAGTAVRRRRGGTAVVSPGHRRWSRPGGCSAYSGRSAAQPSALGACHPVVVRPWLALATVAGRVPVAARPTAAEALLNRRRESPTTGMPVPGHRGRGFRPVVRRLTEQGLPRGRRCLPIPESPTTGMPVPGHRGRGFRPVVRRLTEQGLPRGRRSDCGAGYYYSWYSVEPERAGWCRSDCGAGYYYSWYSVEPERAGWCRSDCGAGYYYSWYSVEPERAGWCRSDAPGSATRWGFRSVNSPGTNGARVNRWGIKVALIEPLDPACSGFGHAVGLSIGQQSGHQWSAG